MLKMQKKNVNGAITHRKQQK